MEKVIGRAYEKTILKKIVASTQAEFVAVYGRRRVGKTFLVRQFFNNEFTFQMTGIANVSLAQQLANFHNAYLSYSTTHQAVPKDWFEAFQYLKELITESQSPNDKKVIFIDELPWLDTPRSNFVSALEHFWNSFGAYQDGLTFIVCGSAASWMLNKLINNKGGLHNRITKKIELHPFSLPEVEQYLIAKNIYLDRYQILQLYFVMGGIPFYLNEIEEGLSAFQLIDKICFSSNGLLWSEYSNLFQSLFDEASVHLAVIEILSNKAKGMTREELIKQGKLTNGGSLTNVLKELEASGFIKRYLPFNHKLANSLFQLTDPYSLFYHKFIKNARATGENTWINQLNSPKWRAWSGYAFEYVCMSHIEHIKKALGIQGIYTEISSWVSKQHEQGAQIDLLIDRKDNVITICEIKYSIDPYEITKSYADSLRNKLSAFRSESKTRKTIFLAMISTFGIKENKHSLGLVQNNITMDALFT